MKLLTLMLLFLISLKFSNAQTTKDIRKFYRNLKESNAIYTPQKGFKPEGGYYFYLPNRNVLPLGAELFSVMNEDSIIIGFEPYIIRGYNAGDSVLNTGYLRSFHGDMRDVALDYDWIDVEKLRKVNATTGIIYKIRVKHLYKKKYRFLKTVVLQRKDIGGVRILFLAKNSEYESEIDSLINSTWGVIRFRPDSLYHPIEVKGLVGKFRYLRPRGTKQDSLIQHRQREKAIFVADIQNGAFAKHAGKIEKAKEDFLTASHILPDNPYPIKQICRMYLHHDQLDSAAVYLAKLQRDYLPQNPKLLSEIKYGRTLWYEKRGDYDSSIVMNKQLLKLRPENAGHIYFALGDNYRKTGSYKTALKAYKKAQQLYIEKSPHHREASAYNYRIGECYDRLSNKQLAKKYFKKAQEEGYALPEEVKEKYEL